MLQVIKIQSQPQPPPLSPEQRVPRLRILRLPHRHPFRLGWCRTATASTRSKLVMAAGPYRMPRRSTLTISINGILPLKLIVLRCSLTTGFVSALKPVRPQSHLAQLRPQPQVVSLRQLQHRLVWLWAASHSTK
ncbi:hypothetical protein FOQG_19424 [Fusarium oxysporum f. sp. raphani 54005]|uniref:Uncharacterized protein n=1 Tax=Fusarium oxysporum f. sp. raphani 54005 TaxID=1089458 RepID=X0BZ47_FUSOX|nr:hypothetical protein FOQG_19424 [Fusarium oxysporum f. sp. raphani 54005]